MQSSIGCNGRSRYLAITIFKPRLSNLTFHMVYSSYRRDPNNYRGLTINSSLSKVFTTVLNNRLQKYLEDNDVINRYQIGFSKKSQTIDHMLILKTLADKYKAINQKLYFGFVDFKKAYDTVWRDGLIFKLLSQKINGKFLSVIKSMYQTSECCVKIDKFKTEFFQNNIGVMQGEVLSPLLFNLYINDLPDFISDHDSPNLNGSAIDCLLYADDLVLMSTSKAGLQRKFDKLGQYCDDWRLTVNTDKTKVMQVSNGAKLPSPSSSIKFKNSPLAFINTYKYLGIVFDSVGNFNAARQNMYERGQKALFKLKSVIDRDFLSPKISLDLFDKTVKPVCLYGSDIWTCLNVPQNNTCDDFIESFLKKTQIDKVSTSFCKWLLGVHKYSSNFGVLGELGRHSLCIDALKSVIQYWKKLQTKRTQKSLLHDCLCESEIIDVMGGKSFKSWIRQICSLFGIENVLNISNHNISSKLKSSFESMWKRKINKDKKLRTYCKIKEHFRYEDYLDDLKFCERRLVTKLRISAHNFRIETGRHTRPITPLEDRKCIQCTSGDIEDEFHVIINCPKYAEKRLYIFKNIISECPSFATLNDESKFYFMLNCGGQFAKQVSDLLHYILSKQDNPRRSS